MSTQLLRGDCLAVLKTISANSLDALVTDPPAGISFMGKAWDSDRGGRDGWIMWLSEIMRECLRVMKPGAHGLVWAIPRTSHWTGTALESAGFEIRDQIFQIFGSGFPKSLDIRKSSIKSGIGCACEDVRSVRSRVDAEDALSKSAQQNVQSKVRRDSCPSDLPGADKAPTKHSNRKAGSNSPKRFIALIGAGM